MTQTAEDRFWSKVEKTETCWLWTIGKNQDGYGVFRVNGRQFKAHRFAYELLVGPIPEGMELDHIKVNGCTSRACVKAVADEYSPTHLEPVIHRVNLLRGSGIAAVHAGKTHCPQDHPYDETNTRFYEGQRICRSCERDRSRARRERATLSYISSIL